MLDDVEKKLLVHSWRLVVPIKDTAADLFYRRLFELEPAYRRLFHGDIAAQKQKLIAMMSFVVQSLDWPDSAWRDEVAEEDDLFLVVLALGRRHAELYRVPDVAYDLVGQALLWTLDYGLGKEFTPAVQKAWSKAYGLLATAMKMGRLSVVSPATSEPRVAGGAGAGRPEAEPS